MFIRLTDWFKCGPSYPLAWVIEKEVNVGSCATPLQSLLLLSYLSILYLSEKKAGLNHFIPFVLVVMASYLFGIIFNSCSFGHYNNHWYHSTHLCRHYYHCCFIHGLYYSRYLFSTSFSHIFMSSPPMD